MKSRLAILLFGAAASAALAVGLLIPAMSSEASAVTLTATATARPSLNLPHDGHNPIATVASTYNAQQLRFFDDRGDIYSVYIQGPNQNGTPESYCLNTPGHTTQLPNWWWAKTTYVTPYTGYGCTGRVPVHLWITVPSTFDGYYWRCLSDKPPYSDWSC